MNRTRTIFAIFVFSFCVLFIPWSAAFGDEQFIIVSALHSPPPGYAVEKTFGNYQVLKFHEFTVFFGKEVAAGVGKKINEADEEMRRNAQMIGANAIIANKVDVQFTPGSGKVHFLIVYQGEVVLLKKVQ